VETGRTLLTVFVALLLPLAVERLRVHLVARLVAAAVLGALGLAFALDTWRGWLVVAACVGAQAVVRAPVSAPSRAQVAAPLTARHWRSVALAGLAAVGALALALTDSALYRSGWEELTDGRSRVALVLLGLAAATLAWGFVVEAAVASLSAQLERLEEEPRASGIRHAGRSIGWIERGLVFGGVALGRPELVAVVVAVKSVARLPEFKDEAFAEYFLIGSLLSLAGALGAGVVVRLLLGLDVF
jgi:hypothetical protein